MDNYEQRDEYRRRRIFSMPSPKPYAEIEKLVRMARQDYEKLTGKTPGDNIPLVRSWDDEIQVYFDLALTEEDFKRG